MNNKTKLAFVYYGNSTFVEQDYVLLSKHFTVTKVEYRGISDVFKILMAVFKSDISFSWFADGWAFFAVLFSKLFRKKSIVVIGGYEVACVPEINYGVCTLSKARQWMIKFALNNADVLLPVSDNLKSDCYKYLKYPRDIFVVNTGYNSKKFKADINKSKHSVLTVISGRDNIIRLKGLDTFTEAAKHFRDVKFIIVGISGEDNRTHLMKSSNVLVMNKIPQEHLIAYYQRAKVYCQLSLREGLPNALCEAMLCECIPVGSTAMGIKLSIGDTGFYAPYGDVEKTVNAIREALKSDKGKEARERIKNKFPVERRGKELVKIVRGLTN